MRRERGMGSAKRPLERVRLGGRLLEEAHVAGHVPALGHHLFLDERERHGDEDEPEQQVPAAGDQLQLPVLRVGALERLAGHQVAEPDGGQRDEAKVRAVNERPALPGSEHGGAQAYVTEQHEQYQGDGHAGWRRVDPPLGRRYSRRCRRAHSRRSRRRRLLSASVLAVGLAPFPPPPLLLLGVDQRHPARRSVRTAVQLAAE